MLCTFTARRARTARRVLAGLALATAVIAFLPERTGGATHVPAPRPVGSRDAAARLLVFGIDGADWKLIDRLLAKGDLPNLARPCASAGPGATSRPLFPTRSPAVWTTIATGQPPNRHGIESFTTRRVAGIQGVFRHSQRPKGIGFGWLNQILDERGLVVDGPITSSTRRVPAFWNLASEAGSPISVIDWWATWPAEPVLGAVVSDRVNYWRQAERGHPPEDADLTYPPALQEDIRQLILPPEKVTIDQARPFLDVTPAEFDSMMASPFRGKTVESEFKYLYSMYETDRRVALHVIEGTRKQYGAPADLMVLLRTVDIASHSALQYSELVDDHLGGAARGREALRARGERSVSGRGPRAGRRHGRFRRRERGRRLRSRVRAGDDRRRRGRDPALPPHAEAAGGVPGRRPRLPARALRGHLRLRHPAHACCPQAPAPGPEPSRPPPRGSLRARLPLVRPHPARGRLQPSGLAPRRGRGSAADEEALEGLRALGYIK